jgi:hypothetical protein
MRRWQSGFSSQHYFELLARAHVDLYRGDGGSAWRRVEATWPALRASLLLRLQGLRVELRHLRARAALAAAARDPALVDEAEREGRRIAGEDQPWAAPFAVSIRAGVAAARGRGVEAAALFEEAARAFDGLEMALHAGASRRRAGGLRDAEDQVRAADEEMRARGVVAPERMARLFAPGGP